MPAGPFPSATSTLAIIPLGVDSKCYRTDEAAYDTECKNVSGAAIKNAKASKRITRKGDGRKSRSIVSSEQQSVDFVLRDVRTEEADSQEVFAFAAAYNLNQPIDLLFLDGEKTTVNALGWAGDWIITKFDRNENDEDDTNYSVSAEPAVGTDNPVRMVFVATGGTLTDHAAS